MHDPRSETSREQHDVLVAVAVTSGAVASYDLSAESMREGEPVGAQAH